jgi:HPt (histidine-containing phosphotransfer) domain-containing protein
VNDRDQSPDPTLDLNVLGEVCTPPNRLDDPILKRLVGLFLLEEGPRLGSLAGLAGERDRTGLADAAHKLAGSCAVIGARRVQAAGQRLERLARDGTWGEVEAQLANVGGAWALLLAEFGRLGLL